MHPSMQPQKSKIIGVVTRKLPYELANQIYNEFESRYKEAIYFIENFSYYKSLKKDVKTVELLLALSIFQKRVISNLDAAIKFDGTVRRHSTATAISIGSYNLDLKERNRLLGILIEYRKIKIQFQVGESIVDYNETKQFLRQLIKFRREIGKGKNTNNKNDFEEEDAF